MVNQLISPDMLENLTNKEKIFVENFINKIEEDKELEGMGTTLEVCLIYNNKIFIGHVGDSRIYRIRQNVMRKLHSIFSFLECKKRQISQLKEILAEGWYQCYLETKNTSTPSKFQEIDVPLLKNIQNIQQHPILLLN